MILVLCLFLLLEIFYFFLPLPSSFLTLLVNSLCPPQHAMMLPVLTHHIRYHQCLMHLDKLIAYVFKERCLLQVRICHDGLMRL